MRYFIALLIIIPLLAACGRGRADENDPVAPYDSGAVAPTRPGAIAPEDEKPGITAPAAPQPMTPPVAMRYEPVTALIFTDVRPFRNGLAAVQTGDVIWTNPGQPLSQQDLSLLRWGYVDAQGILSVPMIYADIGEFYEGIAWAETPEGHDLLINDRGEEVFAFPEGLARNPVMRGMFMASFIAGQIIIEPLPDRESFYIITEGVCAESGDTRYGVINRLGEEILPPTYAFIGEFADGLALTQYDTRRWGFIDTQGDWAIESVRVPWLPFFVNGMAAISHRQGNIVRWGVMDTLGNMVVPLSGDFFHIFAYSDGLAMFIKETDYDHEPDAEVFHYRFGFMDTSGEIVIPPTFHSARPFSEGLAAVMWRSEAIFCDFDCAGKHKTAFGFIDSSGNPVTDFLYDEVRSFSDGMAAVAQYNAYGQLQWGFVNTAGELTIPPQFTWVDNFSEGFAVVQRGGTVYHADDRSHLPTGRNRIGGSYLLIDRWGRTVLDLSDYDAVGPVSKGILAVNQGRNAHFIIGQHGLPDHVIVLDEGRWGFIRLVAE